MDRDPRERVVTLVTVHATVYFTEKADATAAQATEEDIAINLWNPMAMN
jgi:hypothetical protein